ncbi:MAG: hypothetical protein DI563_03310 [Variovorax paradoxus]|uniref:GGDEF domain-containing protein n=1 Tax=Variovorax paradoxus TaxID=34073 RepID=A0A2W5QKM6_VARPD|nr:MAG: hypothetical protein DI563_03310 [Variovorax paradoxus]
MVFTNPPRVEWIRDSYTPCRNSRWEDWTLTDYELVWNGDRFGVGASVGLVAVDGTFRTAADVLRAADSACYAAKKRGRSRVEQYQATDFQTLEKA